MWSDRVRFLHPKVCQHAVNGAPLLAYCQWAIQGIDETVLAAVTGDQSFLIGVDVPLSQVISVGRIWVRAPAVLSVPGVRAELFVASVLPLSCTAFLLMTRWP